MKWAILGTASAILLALGMWSTLPADPPEETAGKVPPRNERRERPPREQGNRERGNREYPPRDGRGPGHFPPPPPHPLEAALDSDGDREISADELANASVALKKCDKNSDGRLDRDELRPPFPPGPPGAGGPPPRRGPGGPQGQSGPDGRDGPPAGDCRGGPQGGPPRRGPQN